jgi:hypothetical protein
MLNVFWLLRRWHFLAFKGAQHSIGIPFKAFLLGFFIL